MTVSNPNVRSTATTSDSESRRIGDDPDTGSAPGRTPRYWVDRLPKPLVVVATILGFALPVGIFLGSISDYSVNVVMSDNLSIMPFLKASQTRLIPWGQLWAQYNQDRSFFPNAIAVVLAHVDHLDMRVEDVIGGLMMVVGTALLIWAHKRRSPSTPWLYYCPVPFVTLSFVQFGNTFLGGVSWYLTFLALAITIMLLDALRSPRIAYAGAVIAAIVGSYSSFAGLLIWPTGLALLYLRGRGWRPMVVWVAFGALTAALYFRNFAFDAFGQATTGHLAGHPWLGTQVFLTAVGDVLGVAFAPGSDSEVVIQLLGALILILAAITVVMAVRNRGARDGGPIGVAMICFGVLFALSVADGRTGFGPTGAAATRYTTYDLLILAGAYLGLLDARHRTAELTTSDGMASTSSIDDAGANPGSPTKWRVAAPAAFAVALLLMCLQIALGTPNGLRGERAFHQQQLTAMRYLRAYRYTPDYALTIALRSWPRPASWIRRNASIAESLHLSTFSTPLPQELDPSQIIPPTPVIFRPSPGVAVHGMVALDAGTDRTIGVRGVQFVIHGSKASTTVRADTRLGPYGWALLWNSAAVPDGDYVAIATSVTYGGRTATSSTVHFHVTNTNTNPPTSSLPATQAP
jgi:hypothetical protein